MKKKKVKLRAFQIDEDLDRQLEAYCNNHNVSISWAIRQALRHFIPTGMYYNDSNGILRKRK